MDRVAADAFAYAKASGIYAKAFVGRRAKRLFEQSKVSDLWALLLKDDVPVVPEDRLAQLLERRIAERTAASFVALLELYDKPDPLSLAYLSLYDCLNIKNACRMPPGADKPYFIDTSPFSRLDYGAWPNFAAMTAQSPYTWVSRAPSAAERVAWENRLDRQYYAEIWEALRKLSRKDRASIREQVIDEIALQNIVWALRLRVYYKKADDEIIPTLAGADGPDEMREELAGPAIAVLGKPLDSLDAWQGWQYASLLNPASPDGFWELDPRYIDLQRIRRLYRDAVRYFHRTQFTVGMLIMFFRICRLEEYMIRTAVEGIRMGAAESQTNEFVGDFNA